MKTTITVETDDTVNIHTEAETAEDITTEFVVIFSGMVACVKDKFGDVDAAALIALAYTAGREVLLRPKNDGKEKIAKYKEPK